MSASEAENLRKKLLELAASCPDPTLTDALVGCAVEAALLQAELARLEKGQTNEAPLPAW